MPEEVKDEYKPSPIELHVQAYESYLRDARALNRKTIVNYRPVVRDFLNFRFSDGAVSLAELRAVDVTDFVQKRTSRLNIRRAKTMTTALRSVLSYARYHGDITSDLAAAVPIVANWRLSSIPRAITRDDVARLLASIDRRTPIGCRDYAMILMLARLGLRSSEVISLELDDIDWAAGRIRVRGKNAQRHDLPLPTDVGEAIADYLRRWRRTNASRRAVTDLNHHALAVDVGDLQAHRLRGAQSRGIGGRQRHARLQRRHRFEKPRDLIGAQDRRQLARRARIGNPLGEARSSVTP